MGKILLVEDDEILAKGISFKLKKEGFDVESVTCAEDAEKIFFDSESQIDLIISDICLPDKTGFELCEEIRKISDVYIVMLTALDDEINTVMGYEMGADDYITKPFSLSILVSKVKVFMKRASCSNNLQKKEKIISGDIEFNYNDYSINIGCNEKVQLTMTEVKILTYLMENAYNVISKKQIAELLWDIDKDFIDDNTVAVYMSRLRKKIEKNPSSPQYIKNIKGIGYKWNARCIRI